MSSEPTYYHARFPGEAFLSSTAANDAPPLLPDYERERRRIVRDVVFAAALFLVVLPYWFAAKKVRRGYVAPCRTIGSRRMRTRLFAGGARAGISRFRRVRHVDGVPAEGGGGVGGGTGSSLCRCRRGWTSVLAATELRRPHAVAAAMHVNVRPGQACIPGGRRPDGGWMRGSSIADLLLGHVWRGTKRRREF